MPKHARRKSEPVSGLRVIGGRFRGRKLLYSGDPRTRPMKDRLREAVFNLLADGVAGSHAVDLFAGTGALGLEALSRGADHATLIEQHNPTADLIRRNVESLGVQRQTDVVAANVFVWWKINRQTLPAAKTWTVFCSPPYDLYVDRAAEMQELIADVLHLAPSGSLLVVEADDRFDFITLPEADAWRIRAYPPAVLGICRKG